MEPLTKDLETRVWSALQEVKDPEIPAVSVIEMGMVKEVDVDGSTVRITVLPTFTGCPAVPMIKEDVTAAVAAVTGVDEVEVTFTYDPPWTTDRITSLGRKKLKDFGLAPPTGNGPVLITEIGLPPTATCPFCASKDTRPENLFGPTPCRAVYYCAACRNPFEQFKQV
ncbi:MAG TPA: 1,2-phenylacetyl-CoA epoxidase subunit PaaD [Actinomycetota bacterium]|nr:1,2-phenylacetyl-CoA epoxidase subunit PaaD [Actinomycetota bacterium]